MATLLVISWLIGCWEQRTNDRVVMEHWTSAEGGVMLGVGKTVIKGAVREYEYLRIRADGDTLVYTAAPSGQRETAFRATQISDASATFENPQHDFPQMIHYTRQGTDTLHVLVKGLTSKGPRAFTLVYTRVACP